jgi:hypothetical protein
MSNAAASLEPDRDQLEIFTEALFRYAGQNGFVSIRAFYEGDGSKPFRISPAALTGGFEFLVDVAEDVARRAAVLSASYSAHRSRCLATKIAPARKTLREDSHLPWSAISTRLPPAFGSRRFSVPQPLS